MVDRVKALLFSDDVVGSRSAVTDCLWSFTNMMTRVVLSLY